MKSKKKRINFIILENKRYLKNTFLVLTILSFFSVLILSSVTSVVIDKKLYFREQENNNVYKNINKTEAQNVTLTLINYFRFNEKLETDFFNENEKLHMQDVKSLINKITLAYYASIFLLVAFFLLYYKTTKNFSKSITSVLIFGSIVLILIFVILYFVDFSFLFDKFHIAFFEGNYLFPADSNIIKLFPENLFKCMFIAILKISMIKAFILLMAGIIINSLDYFSRIHARP